MPGTSELVLLLEERYVIIEQAASGTDRGRRTLKYPGGSLFLPGLICNEQCVETAQSWSMREEGEDRCCQPCC